MYYFSDDDDDQPETVNDRLWHIKSCLSTTINLSLLDLMTFPDEVFDYPQVTVLRLGSLVSTTKMVYEISEQLRRKNHPDQPIRELADYLAAMPDQPQPGYKTIDRLPDRIGELTNLVELDLRGQQLIELPESICNLPNLKRLYLRGNQLTTLPARFSRLGSLVCLDVRDNPIQSWPDGFWEMLFIDKHKDQLLAADVREYELYMQKDYKAALAVHREALRWGLHL